MVAFSLHASFALGQIFYFSALVAKPSPYRWLFMVPIVLSTLAFFQRTLHFHTALEYTYASTVVAQIFVASSYILINDAQRTVFARDQKEPAYCFPLVERIKWAIKLNVNSRATTWSHGPKYALPSPPSPSTTRSKFIFQQIGALVLDLIAYEIIITFVKTSPSFIIDGHSFAEGGIARRITNVLILGLAGSTALRTAHRILRILCLCIGLAEPQDCPPLFGDVRDAYTLRKFWGRTWHQTLRWTAISHGRFIAHDVFRLKRGSKAALLVKVYFAFAVTGLIHVGGEYSLIGCWTYRHALQFFLLQAVGITFEFFVIEGIGRRLSVGGPLWQCVGYIWVIMWFVYTIPNLIDPLLREGFAETAPSFGIVSAFLNRG